MAMIGILVFLFYQAIQNNSFDDLAKAPKNWSCLAIALFCNLIAVMITFFRWQYLMRSLGVHVTSKDILHVGFIGFLFNLAPLGLVGGDLVRSVLLFKKHGDKKSEIVASVFIDRIIGLYAMFLVALAAVNLTGFGRSEDLTARTISHALWIITGGGTFFLFLMLMPGRAGSFFRFIEKIPWIGRFLHNVISAIRTYRHHKRTVFLSILITIPVHLLFSIGIMMIALGIYSVAPSMADHFVLHPISNTTTVIPLPLGPYEYVLDHLYPMMAVSGNTPYKAGYGLVIALVYRFISLLIGSLGILFYFRMDRPKLRSDSFNR